MTMPAYLRLNATANTGTGMLRWHIGMERHQKDEPLIRQIFGFAQALAGYLAIDPR